MCSNPQQQQQQQQQQPPSTPRRVFVFDSPRCCSHLFRKLFSAHPQLSHIDVPFHDPWKGPESVTHQLRRCEAAQNAIDELATKAPLTTNFDTTYAEGVKRLMEAVEAAETGSPSAGNSVSRLPNLTLDKPGSKVGNTVFIQDHAPFVFRKDVILDVLRNPDSAYLQPGNLDATVSKNPTHVPDEFLKTVTPVILIRNPLLSVVSMYRVQNPFTKNDVTDEGFVVLSSQVWTRILFDWFRQNGKEPLVVDADDVIQRAGPTTAAICKHIGIDPAGVQQKWEPIPLDQQPPDAMMRHYLKAIWSSNGIVPKQQSDDELTLESECSKWERDFGFDVAQKLRNRAEEEIPNYQYLRAHKMLV